MNTRHIFSIALAFAASLAPAPAAAQQPFPSRPIT